MLTPQEEKDLVELERSLAEVQRRKSPEFRRESRIESHPDLLKESISDEGLGFGGVGRNLKFLGGLAQRATSAVVNPLIEYQKGNFDPINAIGSELKGLTGERRSEVGDLYTGAGANEPASAALGLGTELMLLAPDVLANIHKTPNYIMEVLRNIKRQRLGGASGAAKSAAQKLFGVLRPGKASMEAARVAGQELPEEVGQRVLKYIQPRKTFGEVEKDLSAAKKGSIEQRQKILSGRNYQITADQALKQARAILERQRKVWGPDRVRAVEDAISELEGRIGGGVSRVEAEAIKEDLYGSSRPAYNMAKKGLPSTMAPEKAFGAQLTSRSLNQPIRGGNPMVEELGRDYNALQNAEKLARARASEELAINEKINRSRFPALQGPVIKATARSGQGGLARSIFDAITGEKPLQSTLKDIESLKELAGIKRPNFSTSGGLEIPLQPSGPKLLHSMLPERVAKMNQEAQPMIRFGQPKASIPSSPSIEFAPVVNPYEKVFESVPIEGEGFTAVPKSVGEENISAQRMDELKNYLRWKRNKQLQMKFGRIGD